MTKELSEMSIDELSQQLTEIDGALHEIEQGNRSRSWVPKDDLFYQAA